MTELPPHDHPLDGKLHDDCPMCDEIRGRMPGAMRDKRADTEAQAMAERIDALRHVRRFEP